MVWMISWGRFFSLRKPLSVWKCHQNPIKPHGWSGGGFTGWGYSSIRLAKFFFSFGKNASLSVQTIPGTRRCYIKKKHRYEISFILADLCHMLNLQIYKFYTFLTGKSLPQGLPSLIFDSVNIFQTHRENKIVADFHLSNSCMFDYNKQTSDCLPCFKR